jgi:hypothetical protein
VKYVRRFGIFPILLVAGLGFWAWDASHHDHDGPHGAPVAAADLESFIADGTPFTADDGEKVVIERADCVPDGDPVNGALYTHFRCKMTFADGAEDESVVHVQPNELFFKSDEG